MLEPGGTDMTQGQSPEGWCPKLKKFSCTCCQAKFLFAVFYRFACYYGVCAHWLNVLQWRHRL